MCDRCMSTGIVPNPEWEKWLDECMPTWAPTGSYSPKQLAVAVAKAKRRPDGPENLLCPECNGYSAHPKNYSQFRNILEAAGACGKDLAVNIYISNDGTVAISTHRMGGRLEGRWVEGATWRDLLRKLLPPLPGEVSNPDDLGLPEQDESAEPETTPAF